MVASIKAKFFKGKVTLAYWHAISLHARAMEIINYSYFVHLQCSIVNTINKIFIKF